MHSKVIAIDLYWHDSNNLWYYLPMKQRLLPHYFKILSWTECLCPPQIHILKPSSSWYWHLEMGPWEVSRSEGQGLDLISVPVQEETQQSWHQDISILWEGGCMSHHQNSTMLAPWSQSSAFITVRKWIFIM